MRWLLSGLIALTLSGCAATSSYNDVGYNPKAADLNIRLGLSYLKQERYELANSKLTRALQQAPESSQAHWSYAALQEAIDKPEVANTHYRKALELNPEEPDILNGYGAFLCKQGDAAAAFKLFDRAAANKLYSTPEFALTNAGVCAVRQNEAVRAESYFRRAIESNPRYVSALYQMALLEFQLGHYLSSRGYRQRLEAIINRSDPKVLGLCVRTESRLDNAAEAAECARRLKAEFPSSEEARAVF